MKSLESPYSGEKKCSQILNRPKLHTSPVFANNALSRKLAKTCVTFKTIKSKIQCLINKLEIFFERKLQKLLQKINSLDSLDKIYKISRKYAKHGSAYATIILSVLQESKLHASPSELSAGNYMNFVNILVHPENDVSKLIIARKFELNGKMSQASSLYGQG